VEPGHLVHILEEVVDMSSVAKEDMRKVVEAARQWLAMAPARQEAAADIGCSSRRTAGTSLICPEQR